MRWPFRRRDRGRHAAADRRSASPAPVAPELAPVEAAAPAPSAEPPTPAVGLVFDDGSVVELRPDDARVPAFRRAAESLLTRSVREPAT